MSESDGPKVRALSSAEQVILDGAARFSLTDLVRLTGRPFTDIEQYFHWLGLPAGDPEAVVFTDGDLRALVGLSQLATSLDLDEAAVETLVRSMGHSTERLAFWHIEALVEHQVRRNGMSDVEARREVLQIIPQVADSLTGLLAHTWRRQLAAAEARYTVEFGPESEALPPESELPFRRAIGFADIVSFTSRTAHLSPTELSDFVRRFETRARDIVTENGGRVVKTVGDAILFTADDIEHGAQVALGLAGSLSGVQSSGHEEPIRVGLVWGRVLSRFGDVFGPTVNLASRLCDVAKAGEVLIDPKTAAALKESGYRLSDYGEVDLFGIGPTVPVLLSAAP